MARALAGGRVRAPIGRRFGGNNFKLQCCKYAGAVR